MVFISNAFAAGFFGTLGVAAAIFTVACALAILDYFLK